MRTTKMLTPILIIISAVALRLLPHHPNVAPIAAMALFGGAYLDKRFALAIPLLALFVSDLFLGFHSTMPFVSVLFFLITNFGVWLMGTLYSRTLEGLLQSYIMGLPFFRNTLIGDFLYVGVLFGGYALFQMILGSHAKTQAEKRL
ncbi:MAG: hypothetical protein HYV40_05260 [Candidatus Levybacteria bacterium]|nr:hypothetical protein [Candidatus Levybacteria bacterium]